MLLASPNEKHFFETSLRNNFISIKNIWCNWSFRWQTKDECSMSVAWDNGVNLITVLFWPNSESFIPRKIPKGAMAEIRGMASRKQPLEMKIQQSPLLGGKATQDGQENSHLAALPSVDNNPPVNTISSKRRPFRETWCCLFGKFNRIKFWELLKENYCFLPHRSWSESLIFLVSLRNLYLLWLQGDAVTFLTGKLEMRIIISLFSLRSCLTCRLEAFSSALR